MLRKQGYAVTNSATNKIWVIIKMAKLILKFNKTLNYLTEPTGNIAPKQPGKKYDGGKLEMFAQNETAFLICDVVGFPSPLFR